MIVLVPGLFELALDELHLLIQFSETDVGFGLVTAQDLEFLGQFAPAQAGALFRELLDQLLIGGIGAEDFFVLFFVSLLALAIVKPVELSLELFPRPPREVIVPESP